MNHREQPHLPAGVRRALRCLSLLLVPALTLDEGHAGPRLRNAIHPNGEPAPYLPVLGTLPLRIEEAPPPPDLTSRPAAGAPPVPALTPAEADVAVANSNAARSTTTATPAEETTAPAEAKEMAHVVAPPAAVETKTPPPILPDTTHPAVRPEDFLPYFQVPGSGRAASDVNVIVPGVPAAPAPAPLPPSSATYTQSR